MALIAPKDLASAVTAAKPGSRIELDAGELVGQVVIDKPLVIEGRGAGTWLGNGTGPVLIIRSSGVELRELQVEMTGALEHAAILVEGDREPVRRNVMIRRGELRVVKPRLSFAAPPAIRLKEHTPAGPHRTVPPGPSMEGRTPTHPPPVVRAPTNPPPVSTRTPEQSPPLPPVPSSVLAPSPPDRFRALAAFGVISLAGAIGIALYATKGGSTPDPGSGRDGSITVSPEQVDEIALTRELRTGLRVVSWSGDEERFVLELEYGRSTTDPVRWRVHAMVEAATEKVLEWQDVSGPRARVVTGEVGWPAQQVASLSTAGFKSGGLLEASQLRLRWCGDGSHSRFPTRIQQTGAEVVIAWSDRGRRHKAEPCRPNDRGRVVMHAGDWRLMRLDPLEAGTFKEKTVVRVYASPGRRRAVVTTFDHDGDRHTARFYRRLLGAQIQIASRTERIGRGGLGALGQPSRLSLKHTWKHEDLDLFSRTFTSNVIFVPTKSAQAIADGISWRLGIPISSSISQDERLARMLELDEIDVLIVMVEWPPR